MLSSIKIKDTAHVYAIVRTSPRETHVVRAGDLVPAGTMLVTPDLRCLHHIHNARRIRVTFAQARAPE